MTATSSAVLFLVFNRPETTRRVFQAIRDVQPRQLFVAADGPRSGVPTDEANGRLVRSIINEVDWDCDVKTLFRDENLGCKRAVESAIDWFFSHVERGIILEDDCLPVPSFFPYCDELLEKYAESTQVMTITGDNFHRCCFTAPASYYFSKYMHCWGWATWRRAWQHYNRELALVSAQTDEEVILAFPASNAEVRYWSKRFDGVRTGRHNTWDYGWQFSIWAQRGLTATPRVNLVQNIGFGADGTHTRAACETNTLSVGDLQVDSHPKRIEQCLDADQHAAAHVFRIGTKTLWQRCVKETRKLFQKRSA